MAVYSIIILIFNAGSTLAGYAILDRASVVHCYVRTIGYCTEISTFLTWQEKIIAWNIDLWLPINFIYLVFAAVEATQVLPPCNEKSCAPNKYPAKSSKNPTESLDFFYGILPVLLVFKKRKPFEKGLHVGSRNLTFQVMT